MFIFFLGPEIFLILAALGLAAIGLIGGLVAEVPVLFGYIIIGSSVIIGILYFIFCFSEREGILNKIALALSSLLACVAPAVCVFILLMSGDFLKWNSIIIPISNKTVWQEFQRPIAWLYGALIGLAIDVVIILFNSLANYFAEKAEIRIAKQIKNKRIKPYNIIQCSLSLVAILGIFVGLSIFFNNSYNARIKHCKRNKSIQMYIQKGSKKRIKYRVKRNQQLLSAISLVHQANTIDLTDKLSLPINKSVKKGEILYRTTRNNKVYNKNSVTEYVEVYNKIYWGYIDKNLLERVN